MARKTIFRKADRVALLDEATAILRRHGGRVLLQPIKGVCSRSTEERIYSTTAGLLRVSVNCAADWLVVHAQFQDTERAGAAPLPSRRPFQFSTISGKWNDQAQPGWVWEGMRGDRCTEARELLAWLDGALGQLCAATPGPRLAAGKDVDAALAASREVIGALMQPGGAFPSRDQLGRAWAALQACA